MSLASIAVCAVVGFAAAALLRRWHRRIRDEILIELTNGEGTARELALRVHRSKGLAGEPGFWTLRFTYPACRELVSEGLATVRLSEGGPERVRIPRRHYALSTNGRRRVALLAEEKDARLEHAAPVMARSR